jgi:hypothetical protein
VAEMERELEGDLQRMATTDDYDASRVLPRLRRVARSTILRALKNVAAREMSTAGECGGGGPIFSLTAGLKAALPRLSKCGGARRLLLVTPEDLPPQQLREQVGREVGATPTVVAGSGNGVLLCYEVQDLTLRRVGAALLNGRTSFVEVAARLHTRIDVPWATL